MSETKLVVIGGDAAGMSAASKVRRSHPQRKIVVFERGYHTSFSACGMPYYIAGEVPSVDDLVVRKPSEFRKKQNIDVRIRHEVTRIDPKNKRVKVKKLDDDSEFWESYDHLLIATGASPVRPNFPGMDAKGIFGLSILQTGIDLFDFIKNHSPKKAVIVGGGYIGIEMAEALLERDMEVSMIDMANQVMPTMDPDMAGIIAEYMREEGVSLYLGEKLEKFETHNGYVTSVISDKRKLDAEIVVLGIGVRPNSELARKAGIELGVSGAVKVNKKLETTMPDIWAAGDCAESYHLVAKQQTWIALGTVANKHGVVAGINLSGEPVEFPGVCGTAITKMNDLEISRTGLSEKELNDLSIEFKTSVIESATRSGYYPGSGKITVKLMAHAETGQILGGQIVGFAGAAKRIDTIATAITAGMTAQEVMDLDLSYAPPFSPVWDPVQIAARRLV